MTEDNTDKELEALIARSLVDRGELIPTTIDEVLDASTDDVELPASLDRLYRDPVTTPTRSARIRPFRALVYVGALAAGVALVSAVVASRRATEPISGDIPSAPSSGPALSATSIPESLVDVSRSACTEACCAGAECVAAKSDLATCPTERTCIPCAGLDDADTLYRLRVGDLFVDGSLSRASVLQHLDLCIKVGASLSAEWSCEPARAPSSQRPHGRVFKAASRAADLAGGVAMELRIDGKTLYGKWWSILKPNPKTLCLGYKVSFANERNEPVGTLSMFLERTYYVELARRDQRADIDVVARSFAFEGLTPLFIASGPRHVLALGPFDRAEADQTLERVSKNAPTSLVEGLRIDSGDDYEDAR